MNQRLKRNPNLTLHIESQFRGLPVQAKFKPFVYEYLESIYETFRKAFTEHPRTFAFRVDLRFPDGVEVSSDNAVISRFFESLKAQLKADQANRARVGRVHPCTLRYIWVKERSTRMKSHYHLLILLNNDTYNCLGDYDAPSGNMASRVKRAWASALACSFDALGGAVHFPNKPCYYVNQNSPLFFGMYRPLFKRVSYFAKDRTKKYGDGSNSFGCSRV